MENFIFVDDRRGHRQCPGDKSRYGLKRRMIEYERRGYVERESILQGASQLESTQRGETGLHQRDLWIHECSDNLHDGRVQFLDNSIRVTTSLGFSRGLNGSDGRLQRNQRLWVSERTGVSKFLRLNNLLYNTAHVLSGHSFGNFLDDDKLRRRRVFANIGYTVSRKSFLIHFQELKSWHKRDKCPRGLPGDRI